MVFSTNQVRHLYVANTIGTVSANSNVGTLEAVKKDDCVYFKYMGAGGQVRSDLIDLKNVTRVNFTSADAPSQKRYLKSITVTLDPEVNEGAPVTGQDYILRLNITQFAGMSDEDTYLKWGAVHATSTTTPTKFYAKMAISLAKNFSRDLNKFFKFYVGNVEVTAKTKEEDITTGNFLKIVEVEQDWNLGTKEQLPVMFDAYCATVEFEGDELPWAIIEKGQEKEFIHNGKRIADLEYFCMGERGDMYRNIGWPNVVPTKYLVDAEKAYDILDIHFAFVDNGEGVQQSEKDITIVAPKGTDLASIKNVFSSVTETPSEEKE